MAFTQPELEEPRPGMSAPVSATHNTLQAGGRRKTQAGEERPGGSSLLGVNPGGKIHTLAGSLLLPQSLLVLGASGPHTHTCTCTHTHIHTHTQNGVGLAVVVIVMDHGTSIMCIVLSAWCGKTGLPPLQGKKENRGEAGEEPGKRRDRNEQVVGTAMTGECVNIVPYRIPIIMYIQHRETSVCVHTRGYHTSTERL